jgi:hypothetical protein
MALNPLALIALAFLAGAGPAASPGGLRSLLTGMVEETEVPQALSVEVTVSQVIRAVAPALVVRLAVNVSPVALAATSIASAALLVRLLPAPDTGQFARRSEEPWRTVISGWPIYLTNAAAMSLLASTELVLPALLDHRGISVNWAGPMLTAFAAASAIGAFSVLSHAAPSSTILGAVAITLALTTISWLAERSLKAEQQCLASVMQTNSNASRTSTSAVQRR